MKIKRIKSLQINAYTFKIVWDNSFSGGSFDYIAREIIIGTKQADDTLLLAILCHELLEITATEMNVRLSRPDCNSDYIFVYDHRQHSTMSEMFVGLLLQFLTD